MLCLSCWVHVFKLTGRWRFELFYLDVALGFGVAGMLYAFSLGNLGFDGFDLLDDLRHASSRSVLYGVAAGLFLNLGNMLLMAALSVTGIAVAFVIAVGLSMVAATGISLQYRSGDQIGWVLGGMFLTISASAVIAVGYAQWMRLRRKEIPKDARGRPTRRLSVWKGILLAVVSSPLLGLYYPLLARARRPEIGFGPYALLAVMSGVVFCSTLVFSLIFMNLPVEGEPVEVRDYVRAGIKKHLLGLLSGALWCTGILAMMVASEVSGDVRISGAAFQALNWSVPLLAAVLGAVVWKEFKDATPRLRSMVLLSLVLLAAGIALVSLAPSLTRPV